MGFQQKPAAALAAEVGFLGVIAPADDQRLNAASG